MVDWSSIDKDREINADITLLQSVDHESMNIVIPIKEKRFYYKHKITCLPAHGKLEYSDIHENLYPETSLGQLKWGGGVWEYISFLNWASASGFLPEGRTVGLNFGTGFENLKSATENTLRINGRLHKLDLVPSSYNFQYFLKIQKFQDNQGRIDLKFITYKERIATTRLVLIKSEVHQLFGHFAGKITLDKGDEFQIKGLKGFADEHKARW